MDDRQLMENMLLLEKGACDLFMHGAIESSSPNVHHTFSCSLNNSLQMQSQIYDKLQEKGRSSRAEKNGRHKRAAVFKFCQIIVPPPTT